MLLEKEKGSIKCSNKVCHVGSQGDLKCKLFFLFENIFIEGGDGGDITNMFHLTSKITGMYFITTVGAM